MNPSDFIGKTVAAGIAGGAAREIEIQFYALTKQLGIDASRIRITPFDPEYPAFSKGEIDVTPVFSTGGVIKMRQKGLKLNLIWPSDYGLQFYFVLKNPVLWAGSEIVGFACRMPIC